MTKDERRITLIAREANATRIWERPDRSLSRTVYLESLQLLRSTIASPLVHTDSDVERIIIDRCCSEADYLAMLTTLPHQFTGDVLLIRDETSFLSATGRGGGRILYALASEDVQFYLETLQLVPRIEAPDRVLKFRPRVMQQPGSARLADNAQPQDPAAERL